MHGRESMLNSRRGCAMLVLSLWPRNRAREPPSHHSIVVWWEGRVGDRNAAPACFISVV
jgi:hypothetical protein